MKVLRKGSWPLQLHQLRRVELGVWALPLSEDSVVKPLLLSALKHQVHAANCVSSVWWDLMFPGVHAMWFTTLGTSFSTAPSQSCSHPTPSCPCLLQSSLPISWLSSSRPSPAPFCRLPCLWARVWNAPQLQDGKQNRYPQLGWAGEPLSQPETFFHYLSACQPVSRAATQLLAHHLQTRCCAGLV